DAYYAAFQIPDPLYQILIMGTISACFVPYFTDLYKKHVRKDEAWQLANNTLTSITLIILLLIGISFVFTNQLVQIFTLGMNEESRALTVTLTRIMLLSPLFFSISAITGAISHSLKRFVAFAVAPIFYNLAIIASIVFLRPTWGIAGISIGVVIGAVLHATIQLISAIRGGFRFSFLIDWQNQKFIQMVRSSIPRIMSLGVAQINIISDTALASLLAIGSITIFTLAQNIQSFPLGIIGVSIAVASFPYMSELVIEKNYHKLGQFIADKIKKIIYILLPLTIISILLRTEITQLLFGSGRFNWTDTISTANTFALFAVSFVFQSILPLLSRVFYAFKDTMTPFKVSCVSIAVHVAVSIILIVFFKGDVTMLAISFSITSIFQTLFLLYRLQQDHPVQFTAGVLRRFIMASSGATLTAALVGYAVITVLDNSMGQMDSILKVAGKLVIVTILTGATYIGSQQLFGNHLISILDLHEKKTPDRLGK
ncbi:murein biosynthesis integral membrane protein MurJ, partial [Candidatus Gracilibacteria bacterium]|nr:murein biosynthesis integral membrane protein MurJ [Candidatus Gracilibacteria bacterium]